MASLITTVFIWITIFSLQYNSIMTQSVSISNNLFATALHPFIVDKRITQNVVYSPVSIYTSMALIYLGAEDLTAKEMRRALRLNNEKKEVFAWRYGNFLKIIFNKYKAFGNASQLSMATRLYVSQNIKISKGFNKIAQKNFDSKAENVDFSRPVLAVRKINRWVEEQTEYKIKNLLEPNAANADTNAILVNAVYFKANWLHPFAKDYTRKTNFTLSTSNQIIVDTMYTENVFRYAKIPNIDATALEMPYNNSGISMLIILPNRIDGLRKLENGLRKINLNDISSQMKPKMVHVFLPKFRIEFSIDLKGPLRKMGFNSMFNGNASLTGIFESDLPQIISDVKHKAFLECNEAGTEAAAATYATILGRIGSNLYFRANHSFAFFVRNKSTIFFAGHVTNL